MEAMEKCSSEADQCQDHGQGTGVLFSFNCLSMTCLIGHENKLLSVRELDFPLSNASLGLYWPYWRLNTGLSDSGMMGWPRPVASSPETVWQVPAWTENAKRTMEGFFFTQFGALWQDLVEKTSNLWFKLGTVDIVVLLYCTERV